MYEEAKIRQAKQLKNYENHEFEKKLIDEKQLTFRPNLSKSLLTQRGKRKENININNKLNKITPSKNKNNEELLIDILKNKKKNSVQYNFQVILFLILISFRLILIQIMMKVM